jgi:ubiquinone/menaquinone biosynthesis C-methylase UbiE
MQPERLVGVELCDPMIEMAQQNSGSDITFIKSFPDELPFEAQKFDVIVTFGVLMYILDESLRKKIGQELLRILADDGMIVTYNLLKYAEMGLKPNPYLAYTMKGLGADELTSLFPGCQIDFEVLSPNGLAVIRKKVGAKGNDFIHGA